MSLLKDYKRPYDKISELVRKDELIQVKRGLFVPGPATRLRQPEPFLLANHINGPSYVSLESALSFWGLIPEQVYEITSVTTGRSQTYDTKIGRFSFMHLPLSYYSFGQQQVELADLQVALVASAEKAICDKIVTTAGLIFRSSAQVRAWLMEDMRMDRELLRKLRPAMIRDWLPGAPKSDSLKMLVKTLEEL
jgi:predicted transcriptional regulator of viral defense system